MAENTGRGPADYSEDLYDDDDEDAMLDMYLTFQIAADQFGIPICHVIEIIGMQKITEVPDVPAYVKGVINLRGQVIPVMAVRTRFGQPDREYDDRTCIIVVDLDGTRVGLIVDRVAEVLNIPDTDIDPPPQVHKGRAHRFVAGMGKVGEDVKILLEVGRLLEEAELQAATEAAVEPALV